MPANLLDSADYWMWRLLSIGLAFQDYPDGDPDAWRDLADRWQDLGDALQSGMLDINANVAPIAMGWGGDAGSAFQQNWNQFVQNQDQGPTAFINAAYDYSSACTNGAMQLEFSQLMLKIIVVLTIVEFLIGVALSEFGGEALCTEAVAAGRPLCGKVLAVLAKQLEKTILKDVLKAAVKFADKALMRVLLSAGEMAFNFAAADLLAQLMQKSEGNRDHVDWNSVAVNAASGFAGGLAGGLAGLGLGKLAAPLLNKLMNREASNLLSDAGRKLGAKAINMATAGVANLPAMAAMDFTANSVANIQKNGFKLSDFGFSDEFKKNWTQHPLKTLALDLAGGAVPGMVHGAMHAGADALKTPDSVHAPSAESVRGADGVQAPSEVRVPEAVGARDVNLGDGTHSSTDTGIGVRPDEIESEPARAGSIEAPSDHLAGSDQTTTSDHATGRSETTDQAAPPPAATDHPATQQRVAAGGGDRTATTGGRDTGTPRSSRSETVDTPRSTDRVEEPTDTATNDQAAADQSEGARPTEDSPTRDSQDTPTQRDSARPTGTDQSAATTHNSEQSTIPHQRHSDGVTDTRPAAGDRVDGNRGTDDATAPQRQPGTEDSAADTGVGPRPGEERQDQRSDQPLPSSLIDHSPAMQPGGARDLPGAAGGQHIGDALRPQSEPRAGDPVRTGSEGARDQQTPSGPDGPPPEDIPTDGSRPDTADRLDSLLSRPDLPEEMRPHLEEARDSYRTADEAQERANSAAAEASRHLDAANRLADAADGAGATRAAREAGAANSRASRARQEATEARTRGDDALSRARDLARGTEERQVAPEAVRSDGVEQPGTEPVRESARPGETEPTTARPDDAGDPLTSDRAADTTESSEANAAEATDAQRGDPARPVGSDGELRPDDPSDANRPGESARPDRPGSDPVDHRPATPATQAERPDGSRENDMFSREPSRSNADVLANGTDVPMTADAVQKVADSMGLDLSGVDVRLLDPVRDADEIRYLDYMDASAVTRSDGGDIEVVLGPAAFADDKTLATNIAHEYEHVEQFRRDPEPSSETRQQREDEAYAAEGPRVERFEENFEGWGEDAGALPGRDGVSTEGEGRDLGGRDGQAAGRDGQGSDRPGGGADRGAGQDPRRRAAGLEEGPGTDPVADRPGESDAAEARDDAGRTDVAGERHEGLPTTREPQEGTETGQSGADRVEHSSEVSHDPAHDESHADEGTDHEAQSGGAVRPRDVYDMDAQGEWAESAYDRFRDTDADVDAAVSNLSDAPRADGSTGFDRAEIQRVKDHLFRSEHKLTVRGEDGYPVGYETRRFDADADIAEAWMRLSSGEAKPQDVVLLEHELAESSYLAEHPDAPYLEAHRHANEQFNWESDIPTRSAENIERWSDQHGVVRGVPEGHGDRQGSELPVRPRRDDPGSGADHRQGRQLGDSGGRSTGPDRDQGSRHRVDEVPQGRDLAGGRHATELTDHDVAQSGVHVGPRDAVDDPAQRHGADNAMPPDHDQPADQSVEPTDDRSQVSDEQSGPEPRGELIRPDEPGQRPAADPYGNQAGDHLADTDRSRVQRLLDRVLPSRRAAAHAAEQAAEARAQLEQQRADEHQRYDDNLRYQQAVARQAVESRQDIQALRQSAQGHEHAAVQARTEADAHRNKAAQLRAEAQPHRADADRLNREAQLDPAHSDMLRSRAEQHAQYADSREVLAQQEDTKAAHAAQTALTEHRHALADRQKADQLTGTAVRDDPNLWRAVNVDSEGGLDVQRFDPDHPSRNSQLSGSGTPPEVARTRPYDEAGGLRRPLVQDQQRLEEGLARDGETGRTPDPRKPWLRMLNRFGFDIDPTRKFNCVDSVASFFETYVHGRPTVAAPRTFDGYHSGGLDGEFGGTGRLERLFGGRFQTLAEPPTAQPRDAATNSITNGLHTLENQLRVGGHGSTAVIGSVWRNGGSHVWAAVNHEGDILYVDPQASEVYQAVPHADGSVTYVDVNTGEAGKPFPIHDPAGTSRLDAMMVDGQGRPTAFQDAPRSAWSTETPTPELINKLPSQDRAPAIAEWHHNESRVHHDAAHSARHDADEAHRKSLSDRALADGHRGAARQAEQTAAEAGYRRDDSSQRANWHDQQAAAHDAAARHYSSQDPHRAAAHQRAAQAERTAAAQARQDAYRHESTRLTADQRADQAARSAQQADGRAAHNAALADQAQQRAAHHENTAAAHEDQLRRNARDAANQHDQLASQHAANEQQHQQAHQQSTDDAARAREQARSSYQHDLGDAATHARDGFRNAADLDKYAADQDRAAETHRQSADAVRARADGHERDAARAESTRAVAEDRASQLADRAAADRAVAAQLRRTPGEPYQSAADQLDRRAASADAEAVAARQQARQATAERDAAISAAGTERSAETAARTAEQTARQAADTARTNRDKWLENARNWHRHHRISERANDPGSLLRSDNGTSGELSHPEATTRTPDGRWRLSTDATTPEVRVEDRPSLGRPPAPARSADTDLASTTTGGPRSAGEHRLPTDGPGSPHEGADREHPVPTADHEPTSPNDAGAHDPAIPTGSELPTVSDEQATQLVRDHLHETSSGYDLSGDSRLRSFADGLPAEDGVRRVSAVGLPNGDVVIDGRRVTAEQFARELATMHDEGLIDLGSGRIKLTTCFAGAGDRPLAQRLATEMGREVMAPVDKVWTFRDGREVVAGTDPRAGHLPGEPISDGWRTFGPDGRDITPDRPQPSADRPAVGPDPADPAEPRAGPAADDAVHWGDDPARDTLHRTLSRVASRLHEVTGGDVVEGVEFRDGALHVTPVGGEPVRVEVVVGDTHGAETRIETRADGVRELTVRADLVDRNRGRTLDGAVGRAVGHAAAEHSTRQRGWTTRVSDVLDRIRFRAAEPVDRASVGEFEAMARLRDRANSQREHSLLDKQIAQFIDEHGLRDGVPGADRRAGRFGEQLSDPARAILDGHRDVEHATDRARALARKLFESGHRGGATIEPVVDRDGAFHDMYWVKPDGWEKQWRMGFTVEIESGHVQGDRHVDIVGTDVPQHFKVVVDRGLRGADELRAGSELWTDTEAAIRDRIAIQGERAPEAGSRWARILDRMAGLGGSGVAFAGADMLGDPHLGLRPVASSAMHALTGGHFLRKTTLAEARATHLEALHTRVGTDRIDARTLQASVRDVPGKVDDLASRLGVDSGLLDHTPSRPERAYRSTEPIPADGAAYARDRINEAREEIVTSSDHVKSIEQRRSRWGFLGGKRPRDEFLLEVQDDRQATVRVEVTHTEDRRVPEVEYRGGHDYTVKVSPELLGRGDKPFRSAVSEAFDRVANAERGLDAKQPGLLRGSLHRAGGDVAGQVAGLGSREYQATLDAGHKIEKARDAHQHVNAAEIEVHALREGAIYPEMAVAGKLGDLVVGPKIDRDAHHQEKLRSDFDKAQQAPDVPAGKLSRATDALHRGLKNFTRIATVANTGDPHALGSDPNATARTGDTTMDGVRRAMDHVTEHVQHGDGRRPVAVTQHGDHPPASDATSASYRIRVGRLNTVRLEVKILEHDTDSVNVVYTGRGRFHVELGHEVSPERTQRLVDEVARTIIDKRSTLPSFKLYLLSKVAPALATSSVYGSLALESHNPFLMALAGTTAVGHAVGILPKHLVATHLADRELAHNFSDLSVDDVTVKDLRTGLHEATAQVETYEASARDRLTTRVDELTDELSAGGLTDDQRVAAQTELDDLRHRLDSIPQPDHAVLSPIVDHLRATELPHHGTIRPVDADHHIYQLSFDKDSGADRLSLLGGSSRARGHVSFELVAGRPSGPGPVEVLHTNADVGLTVIVDRDAPPDLVNQNLHDELKEIVSRTRRGGPPTRRNGTMLPGVVDSALSTGASSTVGVAFAGASFVATGGTLVVGGMVSGMVDRVVTTGLSNRTANDQAFTDAAAALRNSTPTAANTVLFTQRLQGLLERLNHAESSGRV